MADRAALADLALGFRPKGQSGTSTSKRPDLASLVNPHESQQKFLDAVQDHLYTFFGGAAGPGKSYILRWALILQHKQWADQGIRGVTSGLFCETYPVLVDRQISKLKREVPAWIGELKQIRDEGYGLHFTPEFGGGMIALRNLDDAAKYASAEFAAIAVDELTKNQRQVFDDLRFRLRWPGIEHTPFMAASNPGSIGHGWVKKLWIDRDFTGDDDVLDPQQFAYIPAKAGENPHLPQSYMAMLDSLPSDMRRAMRDGDWDVFHGQAFSEWRRDLHVVRPFAIPADWTRWVMVDYGYSAPFCALWFARSPDKEHIYVYRELYAAGWRASKQAREILAAERGETIRLHGADPSMWQKREGVQGESLAEEYLASGVGLVKANNDRKAGLNAVREALHWLELPGTGRLVKRPRLQVFEGCTNLIRTLPSLPYDPHQVEDVDTDAEDHAYDALRYGLMVESVKTNPNPGPVRIERIATYAGRAR